MLNAITIDVEDYFHPSEVQASVSPDRWNSMNSRVDRATDRCIELLARHQTKGTFFILGWVARKSPKLVRRIVDAGHEIACHSYWHRLVYDLTPEEFRQDTLDAVAAIGDACGVRPTAYRAPSYSITQRSWWALDVLASLGFTHDSSVFPITHDRYGVPGYSRAAVMEKTPSGPILEVPPATAKLSETRMAPVAGGGYLRMFPYAYTAAGIRRLNAEGMPACVYFHPWEIDPGQPRLLTGLSGIRTYMGLAKMERKLDRLLHEFRFTTFGAVYPLPAAA
ncbi:MAG: XrtA system polysaccharide deacetylase [Bryobacteraceae bacterium]